MKILFINNFSYLRGGSERVLFEEMRMLEEAGYEVAIFSRSNKMNFPSLYDRFFPLAIDTDRIKPSLNAFRIAKELIYSNEARKCLRNVIREFKPDIAHAHIIYGRLTVSVLDELKKAGIPIIMTLHDYKLICPSYLMLNHGRICEDCKGHRYYRAVLNRCHKESTVPSAVYALETWINHMFDKYDSVSYFISPSRFLKDKFLEFGWDPERIVYIPNFVELKDGDMSSVPGNYLLYLGRLSKEKGVKILFEALKGLGEKVNLKIVGDGPELQMLQGIASTHRLPVEFMGFLSGEKLRDAIANARAVVVPSEWYENAPLSVLESFANAKPVIGARIGGIPEMIDEGKNGYLFEPGDVMGLKEKLETFFALSDEGVIAMGQSAKEKVKERFSRVGHLDQLMALHRRVLRTPCA